MKVRILQAVGLKPEEVRFPGDEADIDDKTAATWIEAGYAEAVDAKSKSGAKPVPDSTPDAG